MNKKIISLVLALSFGAVAPAHSMNSNKKTAKKPNVAEKKIKPLQLNLSNCLYINKSHPKNNPKTFVETLKLVHSKINRDLAEIINKYKAEYQKEINKIENQEEKSRDPWSDKNVEEKPSFNQWIHDNHEIKTCRDDLPTPIQKLPHSTLEFGKKYGPNKMEEKKFKKLLNQNKNTIIKESQEILIWDKSTSIHKICLLLSPIIPIMCNKSEFVKTPFTTILKGIIFGGVPAIALYLPSLIATTTIAEKYYNYFKKELPTNKNDQKRILAQKARHIFQHWFNDPFYNVDRHSTVKKRLPSPSNLYSGQLQEALWPAIKNIALPVDYKYEVDTVYNPQDHPCAINVCIDNQQKIYPYPTQDQRIALKL